MTEQEHALKKLWRERIHIDPGTLSIAPQSVQHHFETAWQLVEAYLRLLALFPVNLLIWWSKQPRGHIVLNANITEYHPGVHTWHEHTYPGVAYIAVKDLVGSGKGAFIASMPLLNHLFGSADGKDQAYFSLGFGYTPELENAARRFAVIEHLQYGHTELGVATADEYLADTLWLALYDRETLNRIDPLLLKLYLQTLLEERFWLRQIKLLPESSLPANHTPVPR